VLKGAYRGWLVGKGEIKERKIHKSELDFGKEITLFNSVRGIYTALFQQ
jgi:hypothetical protein